jgi:3-deoxy-manno-octulosonate cytidylyltransferase (CMP-KDO synthetase)
LIYWPWLRATQCELIDETIVATDDARIVDAVADFGGRAQLTSPDAASGSDRIAEVIGDRDCELVVNVQGDEPDLEPAVMALAIRALQNNPEGDVATTMTPIHKLDDFKSPHVVKVVVDREGRALYFSRSPLPNRKRSTPAISETEAVWGYKHLGMYVYRREALLEFTSWTPTPLEELEKLEQLRFLEHGRKILLVETTHDSTGVDTAEELDALRKRGPQHSVL